MKSIRQEGHDGAQVVTVGRGKTLVVVVLAGVGGSLEFRAGHLSVPSIGNDSVDSGSDRFG
jgi:hypothetical protein